MINLRARIEKDLGKTLEGDFGMSIEFISPNTGNIQALRGQVIYFTLETDPTSGVQIRVENPNVTVRRSSLDEIPSPGEMWAIRIPVSPVENADTEIYMSEIGHMDGNSFGMITYFLTKVAQS